MSMYTRCPHCDTYFRVSREQLQASSGQVRCGRCERVFDAFATLTSQLPAAAGENARLPIRLRLDAVASNVMHRPRRFRSRKQPPIFPVKAWRSLPTRPRTRLRAKRPALPYPSPRFSRCPTICSVMMRTHSGSALAVDRRKSDL